MATTHPCLFCGVVLLCGTPDSTRPPIFNSSNLPCTARAREVHREGNSHHQHLCNRCLAALRDGVGESDTIGNGEDISPDQQMDSSQDSIEVHPGMRSSMTSVSDRTWSTVLAQFEPPNGDNEFTGGGGGVGSATVRLQALQFEPASEPTSEEDGVDSETVGSQALQLDPATIEEDDVNSETVGLQTLDSGSTNHGEELTGSGNEPPSLLRSQLIVQASGAAEPTVLEDYLLGERAWCPAGVESKEKLSEYIELLASPLEDPQTVPGEETEVLMPRRLERGYSYSYLAPYGDWCVVGKEDL